MSRVSPKDRGPYVLRRRKESLERTRRRIVEATIALHEEVGPLATTISAIAEKAGVTRPTIYSHFPDEATLFGACTQHHLTIYPPPDPVYWRSIKDPVDRLEHGLGELFQWWSKTERLVASVLRDSEVAPLRVGGPLWEFTRYAANALSAGWNVRGRRRRDLEAFIGLCSEFATWKSLVRHQGLAESDAVRVLVSSAIAIAAR